ncbi:MAG: MFS transporter [Gammaproteobacteria bacterium]|nr:MFS transporter [Gammaproteobacteria bacterium]
MRRRFASRNETEPADNQAGRFNLLFINLGHFYDHFFLLIFSTAAALSLTRVWGIDYGELVAYSLPGYIAYGIFTIPFGWLADKWGREALMTIFFAGIGISSICAGLSQAPLQLSLGLLLIGIFAAIYHPVGLAMVVEGKEKIGLSLAINGVWGNMGVASAALLTAWIIDHFSWRWAFILPGVISLLTGVIYHLYSAGVSKKTDAQNTTRNNTGITRPSLNFGRNVLLRMLIFLLLSSAIGGLLFQSLTFALPKILDERLGDLAVSATAVGGYAFLVFTVASFTQLLVGYGLDLFSVKRIFFVIALLQVILFIAMQNATEAAAVTIGLLLMMSVFGQIPINDVLVGQVTTPEWRSRAYAVRNICSFMAAPVSIALIGWIYQGWGFSVLFLLLAVASGVTFISSFILPVINPGALSR